jgi:hypothetical protein
MFVNVLNEKNFREHRLSDTRNTRDNAVVVLVQYFSGSMPAWVRDV